MPSCDMCLLCAYTERGNFEIVLKLYCVRAVDIFALHGENKNAAINYTFICMFLICKIYFFLMDFYIYRDFAYVARDRLTRIHMCHVFRCDTAARTIANTLR